MHEQPHFADGLACKIRNWVHEHARQMTSLLAEFVAIPTENPPGKNYAACADVLERRLRDMGLACQRFDSSTEPENSREGLSHLNRRSAVSILPAAHSSERAMDSNQEGPCLLADYGHGERVLYFHGHYDVVPAQSPEQFKPKTEKHFLFGRGSCDMKGGIVAMLYAMRALKECGVTLGGKVALVVVPDEETGGRRGSAWLAKQGLLGRGGIGMLTAEPTSGVVWNANRGAITLRITVMGKSAHVGLQHQGQNAFERMHAVVARLQDLKHKVEQRTTSHNIRASEKEARNGEKPEKPGYGPRHSILLVGGESGGGTNFNVVPDKCWFTVDRRINPEENLETEKQSLIGVLKECKRDGIPLEWEVLQEGQSASSSESERLGQALSKNVESVTGSAAKFEMCPGLLETRFYAACGMPAYAYGPGLLSVAHGPNEYVDLRRVEDCAAIYALTAMEMLKP